MNSSLLDEISKLIGQKGLCEGLQEGYKTQNLSVSQLRKARMQAKSRVESKLKEYTYFERLQKTFLYDEDFFISLMQNCSSIERPFVMMYLNKMNLFGNSVDLEYMIAKKLKEESKQTEKGFIIIEGIRHDREIIQETIKSSTGLLDVDFKPYLYWISEEERVESAVVFMEIIKQSPFINSKFFLSKRQFVDHAKDICCAFSFVRTVQNMLEPAECYNDDFVSYES